jgi:cytochrome c
MKTLRLLTLALGVSLASMAAHAQDANAARALLKKNDCFKCHALDKKKDGPSYKEVASKHKGEAGAADTLFKHMTTSPMVEVEGKKEEHKQIKGTDQEINNLIGWILSL